MITDKMKRQVEWLVGELLKNAECAMIHVVLSREKVDVYLNSEKIASIGENSAIFNFPLTDEQIASLYRCTNETK